MFYHRDTEGTEKTIRIAIANWSLVIGHWSLVIGHWSLVIGHWSLVIGHWSLVIGHWSLIIAESVPMALFDFLRDNWPITLGPLLGLVAIYTLLPRPKRGSVLLGAAAGAAALLVGGFFIAR